MIARDNQHETILAEGIGLQRAGIDGSSDDAEVGDAFSDETYDLVAEALLEIDADVGMSGQERTQRFGQEFRERVGVGKYPDLTGEPAGIDAEVFAEPLGLPQDHARMLQQRAA